MHLQEAGGPGGPDVIHIDGMMCNLASLTHVLLWVLLLQSLDRPSSFTLFFDFFQVFEQFWAQIRVARYIFLVSGDIISPWGHSEAEQWKSDAQKQTPNFSHFKSLHMLAEFKSHKL